MSKLGINNVIARLKPTMKKALGEMAKASRDEFVSNFDNESFDGKAWAPLKYRAEPPPKLNVTGQLKRNTENSIKTVTDKQAVLQNESIDSRGRSYAGWHNTGNSVHVARPIMLHTDKLTAKHLKILYDLTGELWQRV